MGYTHYWEFKKAPKNIENGEEKFANAVGAIKDCIEELKEKVDLAGGWGKGQPLLDSNKVCFNGRGDESYETCYMDMEESGFAFCKTGRMPYDVAVCITLLCMKHEFGDDFSFSSDGDIEGGEEGWKEAKEIVSRHYK